MLKNFLLASVVLKLFLSNMCWKLISSTDLVSIHFIQYRELATCFNSRTQTLCPHRPAAQHRCGQCLAMGFVLVLTSVSTKACPACSIWPALSFTLTCFSCNCSFPSDQVPVAILVCFVYCCMILLRFCDCTGVMQKEKFHLGEIAEALGCADPMCGAREYQHWVTWDGAQVWLWRPQSY